MPISINGSGTITGVSVGGLPDGIVDTDMLAADAVSAAKLKSDAITAGDLPSGSIINVVEVEITATNTFNSGSSHSRFPAMDSSYTTQASNSKILVIFNFMLSNSAESGDANPKLFRKIGSGTASEIMANPTTIGSSTTGWLAVFRGSGPVQGAIRTTFSLLDDPGHTAGDVITYEHHWRTEATNSMRLNYGNQTGDARHATTVSTVLFLEVAA